MAKICFTWELGQGLGHLVRYDTLIERLVCRGDEVWFLAKDAARARAVFAGRPVNIEQIEPGSTPREYSFGALDSYPEILNNFGFYAPDPLERQVQPWLTKFTALAPDILVVDHSPTALLANRISQIPMISSGSGFTVPLKSAPMKSLRYWELRRGERLADTERHVLEVCNVVLRRAGVATLNAMSDLLVAPCEWLLTFAELDHYGIRDGARYLGSFPSSAFGAAPQWPEHPGPKVFAYISTPTLSREFVEALSAVGANLCLYAPDLAHEETAKLVAQRTYRAGSPVNLGLAASQCQAVISNGGLNTVSAIMCAGRAQLTLPNNLERYMVGRRLELTGAGLMAPTENPGDLAAKLRAVLHDRAFSRAAERFAERYRSQTAELQVATMLADIDRLLQPAL